MLVLPFLFAFLGLTLLSSAPLPFTLLNVLTLQTSSSIYIPLVGPSSSSLVSVLPTRSYPTVDWTPCPDYIVEVLPPSRVLKGFAPVNNDTDVWPTSGSGLWMFIARNVAALCLSGVILAHKASNKVSDKVTLVDVEEIQKTAAAAAACGEHSISRSASPAARPSSASTLAVPSHQPVDLLELAPQGTCPPPTHPYPHVPSVQRALATDVSLDHGDQPVVSAPLDSHLESDTDDEQFLYPVSSNDDDLTSVTPSPIDVQQFLPSNSPEDASPLGSMHSTSKALLKRKMDVFSYKLVHRSSWIVKCLTTAAVDRILNTGVQTLFRPCHHTAADLPGGAQSNYLYCSCAPKACGCTTGGPCVFTTSPICSRCTKPSRCLCQNVKALRIVLTRLELAEAMPVLCCETQVWPLPIRQMLHEDDWALMEIPMTKSRDHPRLTHLDLARYPQQFEACAIEHGISSTTWLGSRPPSTVDPYRPVDPHPLLLPNDPYRVDAPVLPSAGPPQPEVKGSLIKDLYMRRRAMKDFQWLDLQKATQRTHALFNPGTGNLRALASTWVPVNRQPPPRKGKGKQGQTRKDTDQRHANGGPDPRRGGGRSDHHPTAQTWRPRPEGGGMGWGRG